LAPTGEDYVRLSMLCTQAGLKVPANKIEGQSSDKLRTYNSTLWHSLVKSQIDMMETGAQFYVLVLTYFLATVAYHL
jgi:hypothetical protein